ncbi:MAG TPA: hypothetical protein VF972_08050 [Actinomycetota bacterium]
MTTNVEPEVLMVRRVAPFGVPAIFGAVLIGALAAGWDVGWSAGIGVAVVWANTTASGLSLARAARISLTALYGVAMGGFVVRLGVIVAIMAALNRLAFFSPLAFGLAVVPATLVLLVFETRLLAGGVGQELQIPPPAGALRGGPGR